MVQYRWYVHHVLPTGQHCIANRLSVPQQRVLKAAFALQTNFAAMAAVSSTYIDVSCQHIRPTMSKMDALGEIDTELDWRRASEAFRIDCERRSKEIEDMVGMNKEKLEREMRESAGALRQNAISDQKLT